MNDNTSILKSNTDDKLKTESLTLAMVRKLVGLDNEWIKMDTGKGVTIAVLDSGAFSHENLIKPTNRIVVFKDFIKGKNQPYDDNGHGTTIAGIIASSGEGNASSRGIAPDSNLIIVKVLDRTSDTRLGELIKGLNWVIENKNEYNIKIINLSLGLVVNNPNDNERLLEVIEEANNAGLLVITAVGNYYGKTPLKFSPAVSDKVLAVGAIKCFKLRDDFSYKSLLQN